MTKGDRATIDKENVTNDMTEDSPIYNELSGYNKKIPRIKTSINKNELILSAHHKRKVIFEIIQEIKCVEINALMRKLKKALNEMK